MTLSRMFLTRTRGSILVFILCALALPVFAQGMQLKQETAEAPPEAWVPPDVANLPLDWWQQFESDSVAQFKDRTDQFIAAQTEKLNGLQGDDFIVFQRLLEGLRSQTDLLVFNMQQPPAVHFEPIPTKDAYTLDELLALRAQWRDIQAQQEVPQLRMVELEQQGTLLEQRRDSLLREYDNSDVNSPARIRLGLERVAARVEYELSVRQLAAQKQKIAGLEQQGELLSQQIEYARTRLISGETDWQAIESQASEAHANAVAAGDKVSAVQRQLLDVLSAEVSKPSLELLRKQQLTRSAANQALYLLQENLALARAKWYRFHAGALKQDFDIQASVGKSRNLVHDTESQVELWTTASQTTLIRPIPSDDLNAEKNVELAHAAAQETLAIVDKVKAVSDDLLLVQEILLSDMVDVQGGLKSLWARLRIVSGNIWSGLAGLFDFDLFHVGDAPVTPGAILTMLLILVFGFALSWFIRHLLERLKRRQQFAKSSVIYTLGRILHYVIIFTAVFAALGTIGLNFKNFALIAGALSVGIGFGLQSIVNNFVSGLILLFEGSLRVGDYIELDSGLRGIVKEINTRATVINTNDSVDVVVPNSEFVTSRLTNWTLRESMARLRIDFGVAYGSDKELVKAAALEAASEVNFLLLHDPGREPEVWLTDYGESSLNFQLLAWVSKAGVRRPQRVRAQFLWILEGKLREKGIEIPFPQRDLHLRSGFEKLKEEKDSSDA
jgi:potassium efflux system protein